MAHHVSWHAGNAEACNQIWPPNMRPHHLDNELSGQNQFRFCSLGVTGFRLDRMGFDEIKQIYIYPKKKGKKEKKIRNKSPLNFSESFH